jgi:hypothetical protein
MFWSKSLARRERVARASEPGEGFRLKNNFVRYPSPAAHLAMGVTLSRWERDYL